MMFDEESGMYSYLGRRRQWAAAAAADCRGAASDPGLILYKNVLTCTCAKALSLLLHFWCGFLWL